MPALQQHGRGQTAWLCRSQSEFSPPYTQETPSGLFRLFQSALMPPATAARRSRPPAPAAPPHAVSSAIRKLKPSLQDECTTSSGIGSSDSIRVTVGRWCPSGTAAKGLVPPHMLQKLRSSGESKLRHAGVAQCQCAPPHRPHRFAGPSNSATFPHQPQVNSLLQGKEDRGQRSEDRRQRSVFFPDLPRPHHPHFSTRSWRCFWRSELLVLLLAASWLEHAALRLSGLRVSPLGQARGFLSASFLSCSLFARFLLAINPPTPPAITTKRKNPATAAGWISGGTM